jgi:threonine/homoserine/homoserine lactone efflux protein
VARVPSRSSHRGITHGYWETFWLGLGFLLEVDTFIGAVATAVTALIVVEVPRGRKTADQDR